MPHFQLVSTDGTVLGARELGRPDWPPGSVIYTGPDEPNLRVVDVLATGNDDNPERFKVLVVEPAQKKGGGCEARGQKTCNPPQEAKRPLEPRAVRGRGSTQVLPLLTRSKHPFRCLSLGR